MRLRLEVKHAEVVTTARSCIYQTPIRSDGKNRGWADATRMAKITGNSRIQGITPMPYRYYLHQNRDYPRPGLKRRRHGPPVAPLLHLAMSGSTVTTGRTLPATLSATNAWYLPLATIY